MWLKTLRSPYHVVKSEFPEAVTVPLEHITLQRTALIYCHMNLESRKKRFLFPSIQSASGYIILREDSLKLLQRSLRN